jgi:hypothetical protein
MPIGEVVSLRYRSYNLTTLRTRLVVLIDSMLNVLYLNTLLLILIRITSIVSYIRPYPIRLYSYYYR